VAQKKLTTKTAPKKRSRKPAVPLEQQDLAVVLGPTADRTGIHILRKRPNSEVPEMGTVRPMREGEPIDGEVIALKPRKDMPMVYSVRTEYDPKSNPEHSPSLRNPGPAQVSTNEYRRGWDAVFGDKRRGKPGSQPN